MESIALEINPNRVYSVKEVATILKVHPQTVTMYCRTKKLAARKLREYRILGQSIIDFLKGNNAEKLGSGESE